MQRRLMLLAALTLALPAGAGEVTGRVTLGVEGARLSALGPTVAFLEPTGDRSPVLRSSAARAIHQRNARFDPEFLVVTAGQTVEMPNDDTIFHNVFSFSRPNDFDLGVYPAGDSRTVSFAHPGLVKLYCSIHESMSGAVLVTPSPWYASVSGSGEFRIGGVPPGSYLLTVWNEKLPAATHVVQVTSGVARADVTLGVAAR